MRSHVWLSWLADLSNQGFYKKHFKDLFIIPYESSQTRASIIPSSKFLFRVSSHSPELLSYIRVIELYRVTILSHIVIYGWRYRGSVWIQRRGVSAQSRNCWLFGVILWRPFWIGLGERDQILWFYKRGTVSCSRQQSAGLPRENGQSRGQRKCRPPT